MPFAQGEQVKASTKKDYAILNYPPVRVGGKRVSTLRFPHDWGIIHVDLPCEVIRQLPYTGSSLA